MCTNPITIKSRGTIWSEARFITVPCGKCLECKIQYQNQWFIRLYEESKLHMQICFVTLTYRPKSLPFYVDRNTGQIYATVYKRHVQNWLKRFRTRFERQYGRVKKFKYFITSEYGPRTHRPHYHCIFFGLNRQEIAPLLHEWYKMYGYFKASWINPFDDKHKTNAMRYVAKYCSKGEYECPYVKQGLVAPTFHLISKKIGYDYIPRNTKYHLASAASRYLDNMAFNPVYLAEVADKRFYHFKDFKYSLPRYYKNKIYGEQTRLSYAVADYILTQSMLLREEQLAQLQAEQNCSYIEADNILTNLENIVHKDRYRQAKKRYEKFLNNSQL